MKMFITWDTNSAVDKEGNPVPFASAMGENGTIQGSRRFPDWETAKRELNQLPLPPGYDEMVFVEDKDTHEGYQAALDALEARATAFFRELKSQECRGCGCTEDNACWDDEEGGPCFWMEADLCSVCFRRAHGG